MDGHSNMSERLPAAIASPANPAAQRLRSLERDRRLRDQERVYLAWGLHLLGEALAAGAPIREAYAGPNLEASAEGRDLAGRLRASGVRARRIGTPVLEAIAPGSGDQGILLVVGRPAADAPDPLEAGPTLVVALHGVQDPGNLGGVLRSAWALGADGVVALEGCADPFGSRAVRAAMGAHFRLPIAPAHAAVWLPRATGAGLRVIAADATAGAPPEAIDLGAPVVLLLGGEGAGLPAEILEGAAQRVRIPMSGAASSLNVHAAAAALLFETGRQRRLRNGRAGGGPASGRGGSRVRAPGAG